MKFLKRTCRRGSLHHYALMVFGHNRIPITVVAREAPTFLRMQTRPESLSIIWRSPVPKDWRFTRNSQTCINDILLSRSKRKSRRFVSTVLDLVETARCCWKNTRAT